MSAYATAADALGALKAVDYYPGDDTGKIPRPKRIIITAALQALAGFGVTPPKRPPPRRKSKAPKE